MEVNVGASEEVMSVEESTGVTVDWGAEDTGVIVVAAVEGPPRVEVEVRPQLLLSTLAEY